MSHVPTSLQQANVFNKALQPTLHSQAISKLGFMPHSPTWEMGGRRVSSYLIQLEVIKVYLTYLQHANILNKALQPTLYSQAISKLGFMPHSPAWGAESHI